MPVGNQDQRKADKQRGHDDLQHIGIHEGLDEVGGEYAHQRIHKVYGCGGRFIGKVRRGQDGENALEQIGEQQADSHRKGGSTQIVDHRSPADGAHLLDVPHGNDTCHDGEEYQRADDPFDQVQEDRAKGLDVVRRECRVAGESDTGNNRQYKRDKYLR